MTSTIKIHIMLLLTTMLIVGCSSTSNPYNDPDEQRSRADKSQREISR